MDKIVDMMLGALSGVLTIAAINAGLPLLAVSLALATGAAFMGGELNGHRGKGTNRRATYRDKGPYAGWWR